jgi:hypothetical protein
MLSVSGAGINIANRGGDTSKKAMRCGVVVRGQVAMRCGMVAMRCGMVVRGQVTM